MNDHNRALHSRLRNRVTAALGDASLCIRVTHPGEADICTHHNRNWTKNPKYCDLVEELADKMLRTIINKKGSNLG